MEVGKLAKTIKEKDTKKLKANPLFITQFLFSFLTLLFCMGALITRRFKDNETILWSILWGILGTYVPTAHMNDKKDAGTSTNTGAVPAVPGLRRKKDNERDEYDDYEYSYV